MSDVLKGGGELGARMRAIDWSRTPLGPVDSWPASLKTCVRIILTSQQPMFVWWGSSLINLYNDAYKAIVGGKHPAALGQEASVVWREIWDAVEPRASKAMRDNEGTYDEALLLIMERNGYPEETYYTFSYSPVPDDAGGPGGIICANTDDTQRIIGERQLALLRELASRTAEARTVAEVFATTAEALRSNPRDLPFAMIYRADATRESFSLVDSVGIEAGHPAAPVRIVSTEPHVWPLFEAAGASAHSILVGDLERHFSALPRGAWDRAPSQALVLPIASSSESSEASMLVVGLNPFRLVDVGYRGFMELVASQIAGSLANAEAHEEERRRAEALAEIDRAKTAFFSNVSHEFRTPLTLMIGPTEDALASPDGVLAGESLATVHRNALRLLRLVNSLLDFSRIEAGRVQARFAPTDLAMVTADLASVFRAAIERAGLTFTVRCEPLAEPVYIDRSMWEKVVLNLLSNAFKFTFEGGIDVSLRSRDGVAELTVRDTGTGIPASEIPRLFERFHRVEGARSRSFEGSGIGLALVSELVRLHHGSIRVESEVGLGTSFVVTVPFGRSHLSDDRVAQSATDAMSVVAVARPFVEEAMRWLPDDERIGVSSENLSYASTAIANERNGNAPRARILLADDNADMRDYVRRLLSERFEIETVGDGVAALESAVTTLPDLVLTDVMMPRLDGFGLLRALRERDATAHIPVIMLSARAGEEARVEGIEAGADDYLTKPFGARELLARVALHIELARARSEALSARARMHAVLTQAPVAIAVWRGPEHEFVLVNPRYEQVFGRKNVVGRKIRDVFADETLTEENTWKIWDQVYRTGVPYVVDEFHVRFDRDGDGVPEDAVFAFNLTPLRDEEGTIEGLVVVAVDVTEQVMARRRIEQLAAERVELLERERASRREAESANNAKDEFLATMSHELRTPLNAMLGWTRMLRTGALSVDSRDRALETIERNARNQAALIEDVLDVARITTGKLRLEVTPVEVAEVVEAAVDTVRPGSDAKGVRIEMLLDRGADRTLGDANRLQQVVWNLLSNAVKFTPRGGRVYVRLRRERSYLEIVVSDTGKGIDADFLPHVFERFRQADASTTRTHGGLGLGLSIVKHLVELHGGTIEAQSEGEGRGATFTVRIPVAPVRHLMQTPQDSVAAPADLGFECPPGLDGLRVLVVDDEPDARDLVESVLTHCRAVVIVATSADDAFTKLKAERPDVLVSDIGMPGEDGYSLIRRVRALPASEGGRTPAVALTAYARTADRTRALSSGYNNHIAKPVEPTELLAVVASLSGRYSTP